MNTDTVIQTEKSNQEENSLLDCYTELLAYTGYLLRQIPQSPPEYQEVDRVYQALLERSRHRAQEVGIAQEHWLDGLFPVCAYIDEALLCSAWPARNQWEKAQLQRRYFDLTSAGEEFYHRLEQLPEDAVEIREVYEFCLILGFKGRYFRNSDIGRREDIQYTNLKRITPNTELQYPEALFPAAYEPESGHRPQRSRFSSFSFLAPVVIILPLLGLAALYLLFDQLLDQQIFSYFGEGF